jgi:hypothetical protein
VDEFSHLEELYLGVLRILDTDTGTIDMPNNSFEVG